MRMIARTVAILTILAAILPSISAYAQTPDPVRLRIGVVADGIVRLTPGDLLAAGVNPGTIDPRTFVLVSLGQAVAIRVNGEADGRFDANDSLEFFGQRFRGAEMYQKYTDERVYWLDVGGTQGSRIADADATPTGSPTPPADFATTLHAERDNIWWALHSLTLDTQNTWFWDRIQTSSASPSVQRDFPYVVPSPAAGSTATLRVEEVSRAYNNSINPDHRTTISLNGSQLLDQTWDGKMRRVFTATVPANLLVAGTDTVAVGALNTTGMSADDVYVNYWELDYRRLFVAWAGQLDFKAASSGVHEYLSSAWDSAEVAVWDISDMLRPRRLTGATARTGGNGTEIRFRANEAAGARYWLQTQSTFSVPAGLRLRPPTGLRSPAGGADAVIVTPALLRPAAERLAGWHRLHGRRALVVDILDAIDEFNDGIYHPKAVQAMLAWASANWTGPAPAYLTLMGDGSSNLKNLNPGLYPAQPNFIPPYLAFVDPWQGEVAVDNLFGDLNGDGVPEIAVGRLAVTSLDEAQAVVDKIVTYDEGLRSQPWQQTSLFVADNLDHAAGDFPGLSDKTIANRIPADLSVQRLYLGANVVDGASARPLIANIINAGALFVQYTGHGVPEGWAHELMWRAVDLPTLHNGARLPILASNSCMDGDFASPGFTRIPEVMQRMAGGGFAAGYAISGLAMANDINNLNGMILDALFKNGVREVGKALVGGKQLYRSTYGPSYILSTMMLYGDPAMRVPMSAGTPHTTPQPPNAEILQDGSGVTITWSPVTRDVDNQAEVVPYYEIWRSSQPYFNPGDLLAVRLAQVASPAQGSTISYADVNPPAGPSFYLVKAIDADGVASAPSGPLGLMGF